MTVVPLVTGYQVGQQDMVLTIEIFLSLFRIVGLIRTGVRVLAAIYKFLQIKYLKRTGNHLQNVEG